ncbi:D-alpha,beta-D-heptose 1,7-bisphosphate phosphatase [Desulfacinum hydrothermale DSM 13146]|uniref:D,D-heptose 1,7-bisphosphate phosphatase n=1 Tax=Desulfacinum hydrothermale DSM 13146 TaxID=1121390 RepID=A0A1W1X0C9_9BACT|nr:HAD family hydrolase [Desulfacinum hydrothermale]SMC17422.1 D-alpha,beta-D-heptose 1,7-bisphosphate phosphatase [Desulfacinum hydrothermale DSM 13146]
MIAWIHRVEPTGSRFVFLDRDGVLNRDSPHYIKSWDEFHFYPDALEALRFLSRRRVDVVLVSNQSALNRGIMTYDAFFHLHQNIAAQIRRSGAHLAAAFFCPHRPDEGCSCRKPAPGMLRAAARLYPMDLSKTCFVGDKESDLEAARNAGCRPVLLHRNGTGSPEVLSRAEAARVPVYTTLLDAVQDLFPDPD